MHKGKIGNTFTHSVTTCAALGGLACSKTLKKMPINIIIGSMDYLESYLMLTRYANWQSLEEDN